MSSNVIADNPCGITVADGEAELSQLEIRNASKIGVLLCQGSHTTDELNFSNCFKDLEDFNVESDADTSEVERLSWTFSWRDQALYGVLLTRETAPFSVLYRALYRVLVQLVWAWTACQPRLSAAYAYRSWARGDWKAGTSDVDLILVARDLRGPEAGAWLDGLARLCDRVRRIFPFLGEVVLLESEDLEQYQRCGGFRSRGLRDEILPLRGERPAMLATRAGWPELEAMGEALHAYTRLMTLTWGKTRMAARAFQTAKAAGDVFRCWNESGPADAATMSRRRDFMDLPAARPLKRFLQSADRDQSRGPSLELAAETLLGLHLKMDGVLGRLSECAPPATDVPVVAADQRDLRRRMKRLESARRAVGSALCGVAWDDLYRSFFILEDEAMDHEGIVEALRGVERLNHGHASPWTLPMVVSRRLWDLLSQLPYLECPTRWMEASADGQCSMSFAGAGLPGRGQFHWGCVVPRRQLAPGIRRRLAAESLASFCWSWRHSVAGSKTSSPVHSLHYLDSRVLGLRLLTERGIELPFFQLDALRRAFRREFPQDAVDHDRLWSDIPALLNGAAALRHYEWVDRQVRRSRASVGNGYNGGSKSHE